MKMCAAFCFAVILLSPILSAHDFKTLEGKEYRDVTITRVDPDGLIVETDSGIEKIPFTSLPKEVRAKYHYDPVAAARYSKEVAQSQQRAEKILQQQHAAISEAQRRNAKSETIVAVVFQVLKDGVVADVQTGTGDDIIKEGHIFVQGLAGVAEGERYKITAFRDGIFSGNGSTLQKWVCLKFERMKSVYRRPAAVLEAQEADNR
jgi:ribosomal protein S1